MDEKQKAAATPATSFAASISREQASRFLSQAAFGGAAKDIETVRRLGYAGWIDAQMAIAGNSSAVAWLASQGLDALEYRNQPRKADATLWRKLFASPDVLRQRVSFALSQIIVISIGGTAQGYKHLVGAHFWDLLNRNAFGNWQTLLEEVSLTPAMAGYLTFINSSKADPSTGSVPDENYAREVMQLFSIGLVQLNADGTPKTDADGQPLETYSAQDVTELARVFTGWRRDISMGSTSAASVMSPLVCDTRFHDTGSKTFLGSTLPANLAPMEELKRAIAVLVNHPSSGPFICRQLIQRLVYSHPRPDYLERVVAVWNNNGKGTRGDLGAVVRAILLDKDVRDGKKWGTSRTVRLREPVQRFVQWGRTFGATSDESNWTIGDASNPATALGQSPLRSPSVFNFFRPGYTPPNTKFGDKGFTAPEMQITTETQVAGYANFISRVLFNGAGVAGAVKADYKPLIASAGDGAKLMAEINTLLACGQISSTTLGRMSSVINGMPSATPVGQLQRVKAGILMVMLCPEYLVQK